ncbi:MAG: transporter substrate-binding domain-containing protein [Pseudomonadota bacterium]
MRALSALYLLITISGGASAAQPLTLQFCYEDKQLLPYYAGQGEQIASPPGVTIEHIQAAVGDITSLTLQLQRKPWLRCLQLLQQNKIDALVSTYTPARAGFAVYPMTDDNQPDTDLALSRHATCLVQRPGDAVMQRLAQGVTVARPLGYATPEYPSGVSVVEVQSQQQAFALVKQGRVDATTSLCEVDRLPLPSTFSAELQVVQPPLYHTTGYLVFSTAFYKANPELARQLWQALKQHRKPERYFQYLQTAESTAQMPSPEQP